MAAGALDLITLKEAKVILFPGQPQVTADDDLIQAVLSSVCEAFQEQAGFLIAQVNHVELRNGNGKRTIYAYHKPVAVSPLPVVKENGVTLAVATGYSTTADVIFDPVLGQFMRTIGSANVPLTLLSQDDSPGTWSTGFQNVELDYTGGYSVDKVPRDLKLLMEYMVGEEWKMISKRQIGIDRSAMGQASLQLMSKLPVRYQRIYDAWTRPMVPPT
jgi:hypothetical protein